MKKLLILLFSALLLSSVCFAKGASVTVPSDQTKVTENKKQDVAKKSVKRKGKKISKKNQKKKNQQKNKEKEIMP